MPDGRMAAEFGLRMEAASRESMPSSIVRYMSRIRGSDQPYTAALSAPAWGEERGHRIAERPFCRACCRRRVALACVAQACVGLEWLAVA